MKCEYNKTNVSGIGSIVSGGMLFLIGSERYNILVKTVRSNLAISTIPINLFTLSNYRVGTKK